MNRRTTMILAAIVLAAAMAAPAQRGEPDRPRPRERMERMERPPMDRELDMRARAMELEEREAELAFQREMREIELQERRAEAEKRFGRKHPDGPGGALFLGVCLIVNILLTVWVYQDMRQRNAGSGLWIPIVLLSGFLGALVYAVVRLGDTRQEKT